MSGSMGGPPTSLTSLIVGGVPTMGVGGLLPFTGNWWFVNATTGSDGNSGQANSPFATLTQALAKATASQNDVICFSGTIHTSSSVLWNKDQVHLIGLNDPLTRGKRARVSPDPAIAGTAGWANLFNVTATGCWFYNFQTFYGFSNTSTALICWNDSGGRNCYDNVEFLGFGDNTTTTGTSNLTGSRAYKYSGTTGENTFRNCVFGVDTTVRNATNYTIEIAGGAPRISFENCDFEADLGSSGGSSSHLLVGASGIDRYLQFKRCRFMNSIGSGATAMTQCLNVSGSAGGIVLLDQCTGFGFTHWETSASARVYLDMGTVTAHDGGIAVAASPS